MSGSFSALNVRLFVLFSFYCIPELCGNISGCESLAVIKPALLFPFNIQAVAEMTGNYHGLLFSYLGSDTDRLCTDTVKCNLLFSLQGEVHVRICCCR